MLEQPSKLLNRHRRILTYGISRLNPKVAHKQNMALPGLHPMDNRDYTAAIQSRQQFLGRLGIDVTMLAFVEDPADSEVYVVNRQDTIKHSNYFWDAPIRTDSLVTRECHVALPILFADCSPILLLDPVSSALAVIHAGWHETMLNIAGNTVARMQAEFGTRPENLVAYIGPTICYEHYPRS